MLVGAWRQVHQIVRRELLTMTPSSSSAGKAYKGNLTDSVLLAKFDILCHLLRQRNRLRTYLAASAYVVRGPRNAVRVVMGYDQESFVQSILAGC